MTSIPLRVTPAAGCRARRARMPGILAALAVLSSAGCVNAPTLAPPVSGIDDTRIGAPGTGNQEPVPGMSSDTLFNLMIAELSGQRGDVATAVARYVGLAQALDDPRIAERAARLALYARDDARTRAAAARWIALDPGNIDARQLLAAMLIRAGDLDGALTELEVILSGDRGERGQRLRMIAGFLAREQDRDSALQVMERLVANRQTDLDALAAYAMLAIRTEQLPQARDAMQRAAAVGAIPANVVVAYLALLEKNGAVAEGVSWLEGLLGRHEGDFELRFVYARLLASTRRYADARTQFERLQSADPNNTEVQYALGLLYLQGEQLDAAKQQFEALVTKDAHVNEAAYYLGQIAETRKDAAGALEWYAKLGEDAEHYFESQLRAAIVSARSGKVEQALAQLEGLKPASKVDGSRLIRVRGEILAEHGRLEEAMQVYDRALEDGYDTDLLYNRAMLAERLGKLDVVERDLHAVLEREPENAQALNALGYTLADRTDRYSEAYDLIRRALELSPNDYFILDSMGWVLYRMGRLSEAVEYLKRARTIRDDPEVAAHLAEVLWVMGEKASAREIWEAALKRTPDDETLLDTIKRLAP
jgi:tetratricopeptide (TPR) repeat protein